MGKVRNGVSGKMPAFNAATYSDAAAQADYAALKTKTGSVDTVLIDRAKTLADGLQVFRKRGIDGIARVNCHSPDGIDLALIGFRDADIMRRARKHLEAADAVKIVQYVHALRDENAITKPCHPRWHVFQPGGTPLTNSTKRVDQDEAFAKYMNSNKTQFVTSGVVRTLADAERVRTEFGGMDL
jgi:hypothetical protein